MGKHLTWRKSLAVWAVSLASFAWSRPGLAQAKVTQEDVVNLYKKAQHEPEYERGRWAFDELHRNDARAAEECAHALINLLGRKAVDYYDRGMKDQANAALFAMKALVRPLRDMQIIRLVDEWGLRVLSRMATDEATRRNARHIFEIYDRELRHFIASNPDRCKKLVARLIDPKTTHLERIQIYMECEKIGQYITPYLVPHLSNENQAEVRAIAVTALIKLGRQAVLPVIELLDYQALTQDAAARRQAELVRLSAVEVLSSLESPDNRAAAALKRVWENPEELPTVKEAVAGALRKIVGLPPEYMKPAYLCYYDKADYYYRVGPGVADEALEADSVIWHLNKKNQLSQRVIMPLEAWNEQMAEEAFLDGARLQPDYEPFYPQAACIYAQQYQELKEALRQLAEDPRGRPRSEEERAAIIRLDAAQQRVPWLVRGGLTPPYAYLALRKCLVDFPDDPDQKALNAAFICDVIRDLDPFGELLPSPTIGESGRGDPEILVLQGQVSRILLEDKEYLKRVNACRNALSPLVQARVTKMPEGEELTNLVKNFEEQKVATVKEGLDLCLPQLKGTRAERMAEEELRALLLTVIFSPAVITPTVEEYLVADREFAPDYAAFRQSYTELRTLKAEGETEPTRIGELIRKAKTHQQAAISKGSPLVADWCRDARAFDAYELAKMVNVVLLKNLAERGPGEPEFDLLEDVVALPPGTALTDALKHKDQRVRFRAAITMAHQNRFPQPWLASDQVIRVLADALTLGGARQVLIVEESVDRRNKLRSRLEEIGYGVTQAATGRDAVALAAAFPPKDCLLLAADLKVNLNTTEVLEKLKEDARSRYVPYGILCPAEEIEVQRQRFPQVEVFVPLQFEEIGTTRGKVSAARGKVLIDNAARFNTAGAGLTDAQVVIVAGKGAGQARRIVSNKATELELDSEWTAGQEPDKTSEYEIRGAHTGIVRDAVEKLVAQRQLAISTRKYAERTAVSAARALASIDPKRTLMHLSDADLAIVQVLKEALGQGSAANAEVVYYTIIAAGKFQVSPAEPFLVKLYENPSVLLRHRIEALKALRFINAKKYNELFFQALSNSEFSLLKEAGIGEGQSNLRAPQCLRVWDEYRPEKKEKEDGPAAGGQ